MQEMVDKRELEAHVERLTDVLCAHLDAHRCLAEVLEAKEKAIVGLRLDELDGIVERERALINKIGETESQRLACTREIGLLIGHAESAALRLSGIVPYVSHEVGDTLLDLRDELRRVADRIDKTGSRNRTLIGHSLDHIHIFLSVLSGVDPSIKNYAPHGSDAPAIHPAVLDRRF
jgi:flagellar biosynthesis/type III secretory pathway chaperone